MSRFVARDVKREIEVVSSDRIDDGLIVGRVRTNNILYVHRGLVEEQGFGEPETLEIATMWDWTGEPWGGLPDGTSIVDRREEQAVTDTFEDLDLSGFWRNSDHARKSYVGAPLTDEALRSAEQELGYELPRSYVDLLGHQNGGMPHNTAHRTQQRTSWAEDHVAITGIYGVDRRKMYSLCGSLGSRFREQEWGYPPIGVYFADCPSAGHDMLCLDYRRCGPTGEPRVVHVDQEYDYRITPVAATFEAFIRGLEDEEAFDVD